LRPCFAGAFKQLDGLDLLLVVGEQLTQARQSTASSAALLAAHDSTLNEPLHNVIINESQ
jgi:hypothetical protein